MELTLRWSEEAWNVPDDIPWIGVGGVFYVSIEYVRPDKRQCFTPFFSFLFFFSFFFFPPLIFSSRS